LSGGDWILTLSILYRAIAEEERKKGREKERKKKMKSSRVVACGALFGMGFVDFVYLLFFFLNFCMGCRTWKKNLLHFKIPQFPQFSAF
jgi:hypothetical protein